MEAEGIQNLNELKRGLKIKIDERISKRSHRIGEEREIKREEGGKEI